MEFYPHLLNLSGDCGRSGFCSWVITRQIVLPVNHVSALMIHCSGDVKQLLDTLGGYLLEERGLVNMKVKLFSFSQALPEYGHGKL